MVWALDTGLDPRGLEASAMIKQTRTSAGFYDGQWHVWPIQGVMEHQDTLWIFGPDQGDFIDLGWEMLPLEVEEARVLSFIQASTTSESPQGPWRSLDHGRFLVLPAYFSRLNPTAQISWQDFSSPFTSPSKDLDWRSGSLVWRLFSGTFPYPGGETEETRDRKRAFRLPQSSWICPSIPPELGKLVDQSLHYGGKHSPQSWEWVCQNPECLNIPPNSTPTDQGTKWFKKEEIRFLHRVWWRKYRARTLLTGIPGLFILVLMASWMASLGMPLPMDERTPFQVVQGYYQGISQIEDQPLRELTTGTRDPIILNEIDQMARLFIFSQLQVTQMGGPGILQAAVWDQEGRPALYKFQTLFGITNLFINPKDPTHFTAEYTSWYSTQEEDGGILQPRSWSVSAVSDVVTLRETERGWKIEKIDRITHPLPFGSLEP